MPSGLQASGSEFDIEKKGEPVAFGHRHFDSRNVHMGYHHCPIEPSDWTNGPDDPEDDLCPDCENGRVNREAMTIDGIEYPAIVDQKCETCDGYGTIPAEEYEPDWFDGE